MGAVPQSIHAGKHDIPTLKKTIITLTEKEKELDAQILLMTKSLKDVHQDATQCGVS